jgi:hypothetical protein
MAFDPSVIGSIGDTQADIPGAIGRGTQLKDMINREQLGELQLHGAKEEAAEKSKVNDILKKSDYTTPAGLAKTAAEVNRVSPRSAMDLLKQGQQYQSGQVQAQLDQYSLAEKRQDLIVSTLDGVIAEARNLKNSGGSDLDVNALITQRMPQAIQSLRSQKLPDGAPALPDDQLKMVTSQPFSLATLESWEAKSKQGQAQIKQRLEQFKADTQAKGQQTRERGEDERERADRKREELADLKRTASTFGGKEGELLGAMADRGVSLPAGFRSKEQMKATLSSLIARHPDQSASQIAEGIETGQISFGSEKKETQISAAIAGKIRYAEEEIKRIVPLVQQASSAVPRGQFVPWNQLKQYSSAKISDPNLKKFKSYMTTLSNSYDVLAARGGTDVEKRKHNREMFDTADSPEALQAALDAVLTEAKISGEAAQASTTPRLNNPSAPAAGAAKPNAAGHELAPGAKYTHPSGATVEIIG